jgi:predicted ThiF/HesA family dinucleotide-utilizing enzyme
MKRLVIVGAGALGSHLIPLLRNEEIDIKVIDFDRVEQRNVLSQWHFVKSVGKKKAESLKQTMQFCYQYKLNAINHKLTVDNDQQLLGEADLIIDCLDNGESRRIVQNFARRHHLPCLHGALDAHGSFGRVVWDELFVIDDEPHTGAATCENGGALPFISITASYLAYVTQHYLNSGEKQNYTVTARGVQRL